MIKRPNHQGQVFQVVLLFRKQLQVVLALVQVVLAGGVRQCTSTRYSRCPYEHSVNEHQLVTAASVGCTTRICTRAEAIQVWTNWNSVFLK